MKRLLRELLSWMDRKWPDKIVVTKVIYDELERRIQMLEKNQIAEGRLKHIESEINKFNASLGFGGGMNPKGMAALSPFQR